MRAAETLQLPTKEEAARNRRASLTRSMHDAVRSGEGSLSSLPVFLKESISAEAWKDRLSPNGALISNASFLEWVQAQYPYGIGATIEILRNLLRDDAEARNLLDAACKETEPHGGARNFDQPKDSETGRFRQKSVKFDNVQLDGGRQKNAPTGNKADAGLRRIRKAAESGDEKAKEVLNDVLSKKMSVNKACVVLNFRKKTITVPDEPEALIKTAIKRSGSFETAQRAWLAMSREEREAFLAWTRENP